VAPPEEPPVQRLGRYQLLGELGRGAMGVVYKGHDPAIERPVALKLLTSGQGLEGSERAQHRKRFLREARAAGRLTHPHIVTIYDVGEDQDQAFLVMEYVEGEPLDRLLRRVGALPLPRVLEIADQIAGALDYAHAHGIVHRDVKPANILVSASGLVKVTDFGIARLADADLTLSQLTPGTPSYMAPEQVAGQPVDGRSDVFALGALLYELLTGARAAEFVRDLRHAEAAAPGGAASDPRPGARRPRYPPCGFPPAPAGRDGDGSSPAALGWGPCSSSWQSSGEHPIASQCLAPPPSPPRGSRGGAAKSRCRRGAATTPARARAAARSRRSPPGLAQPRPPRAGRHADGARPGRNVPDGRHPRGWGRQ